MNKIILTVPGLFTEESSVYFCTDVDREIAIKDARIKELEVAVSDKDKQITKLDDQIITLINAFSPLTTLIDFDRSVNLVNKACKVIRDCISPQCSCETCRGAITDICEPCKSYGRLTGHFTHWSPRGK